MDQAVGPPTRFNPVSTTAAKKATAYGFLLSLLEQERLLLPRHPDLLRQLRSGSSRARGGCTDARHRPFSRDGRSRCRVARFSRLDLPDANVPDVTDTVATAGGLVLPRSPFWQSVNRPEVTLPASLQVEAPPEDTNPVLARARDYLATTKS
jgi:hypothetical protein